MVEIEYAASVTSALDQQILRRPVLRSFGSFVHAGYCWFAPLSARKSRPRHAGPHSTPPSVQTLVVLQFLAFVFYE